MSLPTLSDHNNEVGIEKYGKPKSYLHRYVEAKDNELAERFNQRTLGVRLTLDFALASLAFNYVNAKYRLRDISQAGIVGNNEHSIAAQTADVEAFQKRVNKISSGFMAFHETVAFFSANAEASRVPDEEERAQTQLIEQGRGGEVIIPDAPVHVYDDEAY